jgi:excisionase family DNA binding protein
MGPVKRGYTREEAAIYLGISVWKVKDLVRDNRLPAKNDGRDVLIDVRDLDAYFDGLENH